MSFCMGQLAYKETGLGSPFLSLDINIQVSHSQTSLTQPPTQGTTSSPAQHKMVVRDRHRHLILKYFFHTLIMRAIS